MNLMGVLAHCRGLKRWLVLSLFSSFAAVGAVDASADSVPQGCLLQSQLASEGVQSVDEDPLFQLPPSLMRAKRFKSNLQYPSHNISEQQLYAQLEQACSGPEHVEGNSNQVGEETQAMNRLASEKTIKTICETGFNAGHGTLRWLLHSNFQAHIYSFDLGVHGYSRKGASWIAKQFPGRHTIIWGDSTKTLPAFHGEHPEVKCDLIFVDGGHSYDVALADLQNFMLMANPAFNVVMIDDVHCPNSAWCHEPHRAWQEMITQKLIRETESRTVHSEGYERGFAIGFYTGAQLQ